MCPHLWQVDPEQVIPPSFLCLPGPLSPACRWVPIPTCARSVGAAAAEGRGRWRGAAPGLTADVASLWGSPVRGMDGALVGTGGVSGVRAEPRGSEGWGRVSSPEESGLCGPSRVPLTFCGLLCCPSGAVAPGGRAVTGHRSECSSW